LFGPFQYVVCVIIIQNVQTDRRVRSCVGKQFAYQEMRMLIATLVSKFDISFKPGFDSYAFEKGIIENGTLLELTRPLEVVVTRRK
jgi:hypothetical protein